MDVAAREARLGGRAVELTKTEFDLLAALSAEPGTAFTRAALTEAVWGANWYGDAHLVDVHIANLRRKLERDPSRPERLLTLRGVGYALNG